MQQKLAVLKLKIQANSAPPVSVAFKASYPKHIGVSANSGVYWTHRQHEGHTVISSDEFQAEPIQNPQNAYLYKELQ